MSKIIGTDKVCYPKEPGLDYVELTIVLVEGEIGDYAAYCGSGSPEFVSRLGNKISFEQANYHFCGQLEKSKYRS